MNRLQLIGHLGRDPEIRTISDTIVCNISVATSEKRKDGQEATEWHNCVLFGKAAEILQKYSKKGTHIYIEGKIRTRSYEKDGQKKYVTECLVNSFELLGNYNKPHTGGQDFRNDPPVEKSYTSSEAADDLPF